MWMLKTQGTKQIKGGGQNNESKGGWVLKNLDSFRRAIVISFLFGIQMASGRAAGRLRGQISSTLAFVFMLAGFLLVSDGLMV